LARGGAKTGDDFSSILPTFDDGAEKSGRVGLTSRFDRAK